MLQVLRVEAPAARPQVVVLAFIDDDLDRATTAFRPVEGMNKPRFVVEGDSLRLQRPEDRPHPAVLLVERHSGVAGLLRRTDRALGRGGRGRWWGVVGGIMDAIARESVAQRAALVAVRLPTRGAEPFPALERHFADLGVPYLDLATPARGGLHFATDDHINDAGHRWVADALIPVVSTLLSTASP